MLRQISYLLTGLLMACTPDHPEPGTGKAVTEEKTASDSLTLRCREAGLVNIADRLPGVIIDLKYSTTDNFLRQDVYGSFQTAWLQPEVAEMLAKAYRLLQERDTALTFVIFDATRPLSVQKVMWATLRMPLEEKGKYLSNPVQGSVHNYGAAVDLSLANKDTGMLLDMGTPFDHFGREAEPAQEQALLEEGMITTAQLQNRLLLREVMEGAGFRQLPTEWWHYNAYSREEAKQRFRIIN